MADIFSAFNDNINGFLEKIYIKHIALAVSGGADSMALLFLAQNWAAERGVEVSVFTINHNLRPEAATELEYVRDLAKKLNVNFVPLSWHNENNCTAIQQRARKARYEMISNYCNEKGIPILLTGHHLDDMLETFIMKKSKKASLLALAPNNSFFWNNLWILRPFHNIEKKQLVQFLTDNNYFWFEDSSNSDEKYERNKIRKQLNLLTEENKANLVADYQQVIAEAKEIEEELIEAIATTIFIYSEGYAKIDLDRFAMYKDQVKIMMLNFVLAMISGKTITPRFRSLEKLLTFLETNSLNGVSLHHCNLTIKDNELIIVKERFYVGIDRQLSEEKIFWDERFEITVSEKLIGKGYYISSLTDEDYVVIKPELQLGRLAMKSKNLHRKLIFSLPVVKKLEKVIAIPHISYYNEVLLEQTIKAEFKPNFVSRFTHFF